MDHWQLQTELKASLEELSFLDQFILNPDISEKKSKKIAKKIKKELKLLNEERYDEMKCLTEEGKEELT